TLILTLIDTRNLRHLRLSRLFPYTTLFRSPRRRIPCANCPATRTRQSSCPLAQTGSEETRLSNAVVTGRPQNDSGTGMPNAQRRSEEHTSELQSRENLVCRLLREKKKYCYY